MEEALLFGDRFADLEPRMALEYLIDFYDFIEIEIKFLDVVKVFPVTGFVQRCHALVLLLHLRLNAKQLLTCLDPVVESRWGHAIGVGEWPEPQARPKHPLPGAVAGTRRPAC